MPQIRTLTLASLCLVLIVVSLIIGAQLSYYLGLNVRTVTIAPYPYTTLTYAEAKNVEVSGQVSTVNYWPLAVQFENYMCLARPQAYSGCILSANLTHYGGSSSNGSAYWLTGFSALLPNNENYSVLVIMGTGRNDYHPGSTLYGDNATIPASSLLLFTDSNITNYLIQCVSTGPNYTSSPISCNRVN